MNRDIFKYWMASTVAFAVLAVLGVVVLMAVRISNIESISREHIKKAD